MSSLSPLQRVLKSATNLGFWRQVGRVHAVVYRLTGGRLGAAAGGISQLLLTTTGRRSGTSRTVPLAYLADGDRFVVVASNGGSDRPPAWWLNLRADPQGVVQVRTVTVPVTAREATPDERARLWPELKRVNPFYAQYEQMTARVIPVVILAPAK